jgi:hypothetical protein
LISVFGQLSDDGVVVDGRPLSQSHNFGQHDDETAFAADDDFPSLLSLHEHRGSIFGLRDSCKKRNRSDGEKGKRGAHGDWTRCRWLKVILTLLPEHSSHVRS